MITLTEPGALNIEKKVRFLKPKFEHPKFPSGGMRCCIAQLGSGKLAVFPFNQFEGDKYHDKNFYKTYADIDEINENFEQI